MQLVEQHGATQPPIDAVGDVWLEVAGKRWERSVMLGPNGEDYWACGSFDELDSGAFAKALAYEPEVLLLATGPRLRFPDAQLRVELQVQGVGLEVMDHRSAARTYNLLASEGRRVVALFLIESGINC